MIKRIVYPVLALFLFSYCAEDKPDIQVACEMTSSGNYLIKWETFPPMEGTVRIYESESPDSFNISTPISELPINRGFVDVLAIRHLNRSYFKLIFEKKYSLITSERVVQIPSLFNFRDLGGYYNTQNKQIRWGKLYRSRDFSEISPKGIEFIKNLKVKTTIDLRTESDHIRYPNRYSTPLVHQYPLKGNPPNVFAHKILSEEMKRGDVLVSLQDVFYYLLQNNSNYYTQMFDILLEESNYPIVISCSVGKDRTGVASALILAALDVDRETIINDFLMTNDLINYNKQFPNASLFDSNIQETMTALYSAHQEMITYTFDQIVKQYGSLDQYFEEELLLTRKKRDKLKEILLY